jgi:hypothetical protein
LAALIVRSTQIPQWRLASSQGSCVATVPTSAANTQRESNDPCSLRLLQSLLFRSVMFGRGGGCPTTSPAQHTAATLFPPPICQRTTNKHSTRSVPMGRKSC